MTETIAVDMNAICAHCGGPKERCLCNSTAIIDNWRERLGIFYSTASSSNDGV